MMSEPAARFPSPLAGEGGAEPSEAPGEGYASSQEPLTRLAAFGSSAPSPAGGEGSGVGLTA